MDVVCEDVLVAVLRLLPPRSLASSRCVCTSWRAAIDDHRLLRDDLLPLSLDGVIFTTIDPSAPKLFSRPSTRCSVTPRLDYVDDQYRTSPYVSLVDCCNGLILLDNHVVNPATRQSVRLPPYPRSCTVPDCTSCIDDLDRHECLVYDPAVSPHYKVLLIPHIPHGELPSGHISKHTYSDGPVSAMEWPPSPYVIDVFSSKTKCWKERWFMREGDAAGAVADLKTVWEPYTYLYHAAYWHGALYVRCEEGFAMRINLSNDKYRVFKLPKGDKGTPRLGKSKTGVYCTLIHEPCTAEVWFLDDSRGQINWVFRNEINLEPSVRKSPWNHFHYQPWSLQSDDQAEWLLKNEASFEPVDDNNVTLVKDDFKWDSHDKNTIDTTDCWPREYAPILRFFKCFGYHPYEEIVLIYDGHSTIVAYHINSSKVLHLGRMSSFYSDIRTSFAYAPCWMRDLPGS